MGQLDDTLKPDLCVNDFLELKTWTLAEFGAAEVNDLRGSQRLIGPVGA